MALLDQKEKNISIHSLRSSVESLQEAGLSDIAEDIHTILAEQLIDGASTGEVRVYSQADIDNLTRKYTQ